VTYRYKAAETFWRNFHKLPPDLKAATRAAWLIFKADPFDKRLGAHKIKSLSARMGKTVYSVVIAPDLRAVFYIEGNTIFTVDIGTHAIYR
jgi:mRNA-degrading endonuclease YafQ of YafQ-DinJ toxin-antitoxin module